MNLSKIHKLLPKRRSDTHKGDYGKVLLLCGSRGYTGAAALSAKAALRAGSGLVYLGVPESVYAIEAAKLDEPVVFPLSDRDGMYSTDAADHIKARLAAMDAVLIGPGMGQSEGTLKMVQTVLQGFDGPIVLDADGINVLSQHKDILRGRTSPTILTPHFGEYCRFGGDTELPKAECAAKLAKETGCIVVLKGSNTVITDGNCAYINPTGNPGMAVGGSGDVLAGIMVSLLGQGVAPIESAAAAVWLHGKAGDICAKEIGQYGMLPGDMIKALPRLLK
jgi:NAD(P)H-hydrate epimerase